MYLTPEQFAILMNPLNASRVAKRSQGGKQLSYLEAWDVKAHLTRIFGFGNWDAEIVSQQCMGTHPYMGGSSKDKEMVEVMWQVTLRLSIRTQEPATDTFDEPRWHQTVYSEAAVGSATGSATSSGIGDLHDNAIKQAASDALKRCAINLGTQFGLSLYDNGSTREVIKKVLVGDTRVPVEKTPEQIEREQRLARTVGASSTSSTQESDPDAAAAQAVADGLGGTVIEQEQPA